MRSVSCDIVIFGGGVTGLWTRAVLARAGYRTVLLETDSLGAGQTIASQGIIHAGLKYAVSGEVSRGARMLADEYPRWKARLAGDKWPDLSRVKVLADRFLMWTTPGWTARFTAQIASGVLLRSASRKLAPADRPPPFDSAPKGFAVWSVDEPAIETRSLVEALAGACDHPIIRSEMEPVRAASGSERGLLTNTPNRSLPLAARQEDGLPIEHDDASVTIRVRSGSQDIELCAQTAVFAAGTGNEDLLRAAGIDHDPLSQRRPLHMVVARGVPCAISGHCIGGKLSDKPRVTITTGSLGGEPVWYLGGDLSERGVHRDEHAQLGGARAVLEKTLPWLDLSGVELACFRIDRAEGRMPGCSRPEGPVLHDSGRVLAVWPTKLALAPIAAEMALEALEKQGVIPRSREGLVGGDAGELGGLPTPPIAEPVWARDDLRWS